MKQKFTKFLSTFPVNLRRHFIKRQSRLKAGTFKRRQNVIARVIGRFNVGFFHFGNFFFFLFTCRWFVGGFFLLVILKLQMNV
jgi:hypothetical protein